MSSNGGTPLATSSWSEALGNILQDIKSKNEELRQKAAKKLRDYVALQARDMSPENFTRFMNDLNNHIFKFVNSKETQEKIGGIMAIDELIDVDYDAHENAGKKVMRLANFLRYGLSTNDLTVMLPASKALGRLVRTEGTLTAECVEFEVKRALEWLQGERYEARRQAAVLVLKELAHNAPTLFNVHVASFFDSIWVALRDPKLLIREGAVEALRAALRVISERESRLRSQWYLKIYAEAQKGFKSTAPEVIHGSLIAIGELLRNAGDFMMTRYKEVCDGVLKYKESKDRLVRRTVINLISLLASYSPDLFTKLYLDQSFAFLMKSLQKDTERPVAFSAIGEIAVAIREDITKYLDAIVWAVKQVLSKPKGASLCNEALSCISMLSTAVGTSLKPYIEDLLPLMFSSGISQVLVEALREMAATMPDLLSTIQERLLDELSMVLAHKLFWAHPGSSSITNGISQSASNSNEKQQPDDTNLIALALNTLGSFNFATHVLTEFVKECVVGYLDNESAVIRKEAALTCTKLLLPSGKPPPPHSYLSRVVGQVLEKLLISGIADPNPAIRRAVLAALDEPFDYHLSQAENLRSLFCAMNDEIFEIRELAFTITGRLATRNPAYVLPALRKTLMQLLTELEFSGDSRNKEESARLLGLLIKYSPRLTTPYVEAILKTLRLKMTDTNPRVASCVLEALGELAEVSGKVMVQKVDELIPVIIETLQDQSSATKRAVAFRTLGQLVESTGDVITPYIRYPKLLDIILDTIKSERNLLIRKEVIKVFGLLGALDPYKHKMTEIQFRDQQPSSAAAGKPDGKGSSDVLANMAPSAEDYYPTIAITALMRILKDPSLSTHHTMVIQAVMYIFKSLGLKSLPFLPQIMPPFLAVMRSCKQEFREFLFQQLGMLVSIVKQHIREHLEQIFELIREYWNSPLIIQIIALVEEICLALNDEFKKHLPDFIPQMLNVLHTDRTPRRQPTSKVLHALEVFGTNLDDYLHLVVPAVVKLFEQVDAPLPVRALAIQKLGKMAQKLNFSDYASRIIHPLARVLDEAQPELRTEAMETLCTLIFQFGPQYLGFQSMVDKVLARNKIQHFKYESIVAFLKQSNEASFYSDHFSFHSSINDTTSGPSLSRSTDGTNPQTAGGGIGGEELPLEMTTVKKLKANETNLRKAWEASQRSTKEDWAEWIRRFSVELLRESPSPALRSCLSLAQVYHALARELFNSSFVSCWTELHEQYQDQLVHSLETALCSPSIPPEILQTLLNLAEFMEHDDKPLPIDIRTLGALAKKCNAYAKALHYKEIEFQDSPSATIEALISINNQLQQPEAAIGILIYAQQHHSVELKESWYEKLQQWEDALEAYEKKQKEDPKSLDLAIGQMRCLQALGEWDRLAEVSEKLWFSLQDQGDTAGLHILAPLATAATWVLGVWDRMPLYLGYIEANSVDGAFYRAILNLHKSQYNEAQQYIDLTRRLVDTKLTALVGESYNRAYKVAVTLQQLSEMEEILEYKKSNNPEKQAMIRNTWKQRLKGCQRNVEIWQRILAVRMLVVSPLDDIDSWLKFSGLCRRSGKLRMSKKVLTSYLGCDPNNIIASARTSHSHAKVAFAYLKYFWATGEKQSAFKQLKEFVLVIQHNPPLQARCFLKLGEWQLALHDNFEHDTTAIPQVLSSFKAATEFDSRWYKAWHSWALANFEVASLYEKSTTTSDYMSQQIGAFILSAVRGFFRSIALRPEQSLQDTLRLLTLWFKHGAQREVEAALREGFSTVSIDTWLQVIPQLIARIHTTVQPVRRLIHELMSTVGFEHPQACVYPLTVASKSQSQSRFTAAVSILKSIRKHSDALVEQAMLVSQELIRVAILWHEIWHEGLEEASRLYFGEHNVDGMLATLAPLHQMLEKGPQTMREMSFQQAFGRELHEAYDWCKKFIRSGKEADLNQAWDLYYHVFRRINKQLQQLTTLELQYVSPNLLSAKNMDLAVPGTYRAGAPIIRISQFSPTLHVIPSKQRPRNVTIHGSDGNDYVFLLKGHEDLRQDERVMQLFGLVNTLLLNDRETSKKHLSIQRYSVVPLSPNSGLIGWVSHCDTLHALIRDHREAKKVALNMEHRVMLQMAPEYDGLSLIQKVEVFEHALESTCGQDLNKVLWLKSPNSEIWLERRTNYTRSLAVMSMVGYILGLGDRHPSNLMLHRYTGNIVHIDFGDCFEVAMHREKYPEKIPFRLTRMLINAMEVSGIEGNFRLTCENVMRVLRENKESLMAVLEAFVYDPLINWRLLTPLSPGGSNKGKNATKADNNEFQNTALSRSQKDERQLVSEWESAMPEILNERAVTVINRVSKKLTGRDFSTEKLNVQAQVQRLIDQATSHENLCQCYIGWCPFW